EKSHQASEAERLEGLTEIEIRTAAARNGGAKLRVDETVGEREYASGYPRIDDVRAVHGLHHERDRQERPNAHHADDVGGRRLLEAHGPFELRAFCGCCHASLN